VRLAGDIDIASAAVLSKTVDWLTTMAPVNVVLDLGDVTFARSALPISSCNSSKPCPAVPNWSCGGPGQRPRWCYGSHR
jgi:hypothetical protein